MIKAGKQLVGSKGLGGCCAEGDRIPTAQLFQCSAAEEYLVFCCSCAGSLIAASKESGKETQEKQGKGPFNKAGFVWQMKGHVF